MLRLRADFDAKSQSGKEAQSKARKSITNELITLYLFASLCEPLRSLRQQFSVPYNRS